MLQELSLRKFKSWDVIQSMRLAPITGLFGTNSSGKSSVFQSLLLLKQTLESADRSLPLHFGSERDYIELGTYRDVVFKHKPDSSMRFSFQWKLKEKLEVDDPSNPTDPPLFHDDTMTFSTEVYSTQRDKLRVKKFSYSFSGQEFSLAQNAGGTQYKLSPTTQSDRFRFIRTPGRAWDIPPPVKFHGFPDQVFTYYQNTAFLLDLQRQLEELFARMYYLGPLREHPKRRYVWSGGEPADMGRRGERTVDAILAARNRGKYISPGYRKKKRTLEERIAEWLKELGLIYSFKVDSIGANGNLFEVKVRRFPNSPDVLITDVGFGVSQLLPIIALCYYVPKGSTILLEQPEIHLHPSVQMGLADVFIDVMKNRGVQILLESHSEHLLARLQRRLAEGGLKKEDVALYFCASETNQSTLTPLALDLLGNISNWPEDFFGDRFGETAAIQEARLRRRREEESGQ